MAIHDVAPETFDDVRYLGDALDRLGIRPRVFKVIPQHLLESRELVHFLQAEQEAGSEIVLHGYAHRRHGRFHGPWRRRFRARLFARHDAELLTVPPQQLEPLLRDGRSLLATAQLIVRGFCAPGWIEPSGLRPVLRRLGFRYDVRMASIVDLATGHHIWTDWMGYMGAGGRQEQLVGIANLINRRAMPIFPVVKVFLHPQGARRSQACRQLLESLPQLRHGRTLTTYGELVGRQA